MPYRNSYDYIQQVFAPETPELEKIRRTTTDPNDQISIAPTEGKLLQVLIKMAGTKTVVEIGTLAGYSARWMADALPENGHIYTFEKDATRAKLYAANLKHPKITVIIGDALETLPSIESKGPFDMAFIDADKLAYAQYLDWVEKNIRKGGLIVGDNTFLFGTVWQDSPTDDRVRQTAWKAMREFNSRLADPARYTSILLPTEQGMTVAVKNF
jgi:predicted O-methyltransferase YrrM